MIVMVLEYYELVVDGFIEYMLVYIVLMGWWFGNI